MKWINKIILILAFINLNSVSAQQEAEKLTLDQCIQLALKNNPSLQRGGISIAQAHLSIKQSYSDLYPSVDISASTSTSDNNLPDSDWKSQWNIQGSINQNIYRPGMYSGVQLAKTNEKISQISNDDLETQIRLIVENYYYQVLTSYALISVYQENIRIADENLEKIRMMYKVGARTESDVLKAEVQQGDFKALLISEQEKLLGYKRSLNTVMGRSPAIAFDVENISSDDVDIPDLEVEKSLLLENNREYQALEQTLKSQKISLKIAKEAFLPSLSGYYSYSKSNDWTGGADFKLNQIGIRASLDLFNGFNKKLNVQKEHLDLEKVEIELQEKQRDLMEQLTNLYTSLQTYNSLISIHVKNVESSKRDLKVVTERYAVGASTTLDQMNAQASLLQSQSNLVKVKYSRKIVEAQIKQLLGN